MVSFARIIRREGTKEGRSAQAARLPLRPNHTRFRAGPRAEEDVHKESPFGCRGRRGRSKVAGGGQRMEETGQVFRRFCPRPVLFRADEAEARKKEGKAKTAEEEIDHVQLEKKVQDEGR